MQVQVSIEFDQLLKIVRDLPSMQLKQLKTGIEKEAHHKKSGIDLETLLLNGPTATKKQLETIAKNRKAINEWRKV
jgi:mevalonate kinase